MTTPPIKKPKFKAVTFNVGIIALGRACLIKTVDFDKPFNFAMKIYSESKTSIKLSLNILTA